MELIYLYIDDVGRPLKRTGISFGRQFETEYSRESKELLIAEKRESVPRLYGERIQSIDLLAGQNGTGKTTVLDLLGQPLKERSRLFDMNYPDITIDEIKKKGLHGGKRWFALYHIDGDTFLLEGFYDMVEFIRSEVMETERFDSYWQCSTFLFQYDVKNSRLISGPDNVHQYSLAAEYDRIIVRNGRVELLLDDSDVRKPLVTQGIAFVLYQQSSGVMWLNEASYGCEDDYDSAIGFFHRVRADHIGHAAVTKFLFDATRTKDNTVSRAMTGIPGCAVRIQFKPKDKIDLFQWTGWEPEQQDDYIQDESMRKIIAWEIVGQLIYGDKAVLLNQPIYENFWLKWRDLYTRPQLLALMYLEEICWSLLRENILHDREFRDEKPLERFRKIAEPFREKQYDSSYYEEYEHHRAAKQNISFEERRNILLDIISDDTFDRKVAGIIADGISNLPEDYISFDGSGGSIRFSEIKESDMEPLMALMEGMDVLHEYSRYIYGSHSEVLPVTYEGLSTGEAQFIDFYATLYKSLQQLGRPGYVPENAVIVLLLDEPDSRFHPEWSRQFILKLNHLLNPPDEDSSEIATCFRRYRYQVILTTHSPLLMSDIPSPCIHCFEPVAADPGGSSVQVRPTRYGFMSSMNDMLTDSFFTGSVFGAFAEEFVNGLIHEMEDMESSLEAASASQKDRLSLDELRDMNKTCGGMEEKLQIIRDEIIYLSLRRRLDRIQNVIEYQIKKSE